MTSNDTPPPQPPVSLGFARLFIAVVAALLVTGGVLAGLFAIIGDPSAWRGFAAGTVASVVAGVASTLPLWIGSQFGMMGAVGGFFTAGFVRAAVALGGCLLAVLLWKYPPVATFVSMGVYYLAVLAAESTVVGRALWKRPNE